MAIKMKKLLKQGLLGAVSSLCLASGIAYAQVPPAQTGQAFPGRVEEQLPQESLVPREVPNIEVRSAPAQKAPPGAEKVNFTLRELRLEGATVYGENELRAVYGDALGHPITLSDLYGIANELTRKYRNDGYVLTQVVVPPQTIDGGVARLRVVEGFVDRVEVRGDTSGMDYIRGLAGQIKTGGQAVNIRQMERSLLLINDLPGVKARSVLSPSKRQPGAADLLIIVERKPYDAMIGVDNFGTKYLGPLQATAAGSLNSFFGVNDKITAQYVTTPDHDLNNELHYFGFAYEQPVWQRGTTLEIFNNYTFTDPGHTLAQFDVHGKSTMMGARLKHPFVRTRNMSLYGRAGFDMRNVNSSNNIEPRREDTIRAARFGGRFEILDTIFGAAATAFNILDGQISRGLDIWGATNDDDPNVSRPAADATFTKLEFEYQRLQRFSPQVNILMGLTGQVSDGPLYASEEFGVGGQSYGRGYDPSEILGDDGIAGKFELQWNEPYEMSLLDSYQLYGFYDIGHIWNDDAATPSQNEETAASTGFGIRATFDPATSAGMTMTFPLNRDVQTMGDEDPRFFFNLSHRF